MVREGFDDSGIVHAIAILAVEPYTILCGADTWGLMVCVGLLGFWACLSTADGFLLFFLGIIHERERKRHDA